MKKAVDEVIECTSEWIVKNEKEKRVHTTLMLPGMIRALALLISANALSEEKENYLPSGSSGSSETKV